MISTLIFTYLQKSLALGLKVVKIWLWILTLFFLYALYSSKKWYDKVQENANLSIQLVENKAKIDSLKIYQNIWKKENEALRVQLLLVENKINILDKKLIEDLRNDKVNPKNMLDNSDDNTLRTFTKRHGSGSVRYYNLRADTLKNIKRNQPRPRTVRHGQEAL